jgi:DNA polymerase IV
LPIICRDCFSTGEGETSLDIRCRECGSPRLVSHADLFSLRVAHLDCDAFYASVEKRDTPELRLQPVIIGGGRRGVVAAACYMARRYGIRSAMPMFKARAACPHVVVIRPNMNKYAAVGSEIRTLMRRTSAVVEPVSIDEAYLDFSASGPDAEPPALILARLAASIETELGLTVSIGLGPNKFLAKIASDLDKPRGYAVIGANEAAAFLRRMPVSLIHGVGHATQVRMERDGIQRIGQLRTFPAGELVRRYGSFGERLSHFSRGIDHRGIKNSRPTKSISAETTFEDPIRSLNELSDRLVPLVERVATRMRARGYWGTTVTLKLKTASFQTFTRSHTLTEATSSASVIGDIARALLIDKAGDVAFRLMGVGVANLVEAADMPSLLTGIHEEDAVIDLRHNG